MDATAERPTLKVELIRPATHSSLPLWRLVEPMTLHGHTVPAGFETDMTSSPKWAILLFPPAGYATEEAVLHDYLVGELGWVAANRIFDEHLGLYRLPNGESLPRWRRWAKSWAVRIGGAKRILFNQKDRGDLEK